MNQQGNLFGKTFDQQVHISGGNLDGADIRPNTCIPGEIVLEPLPPGIRITARDADHRTLWGFVASKGMLEQVHCLVAVYDTLQTRIGHELRKQGLPAPEREDAVECAKRALDDLEETVRQLRESITVKKVSEATLRRAEVIRGATVDARRMIELTLKALTLRDP